MLTAKQASAKNAHTTCGAFVRWCTTLHLTWACVLTGPKHTLFTMQRCHRADPYGVCMRPIVNYGTVSWGRNNSATHSYVGERQATPRYCRSHGIGQRALLARRLECTQNVTTAHQHCRAASRDAAAPHSHSRQHRCLQHPHHWSRRLHKNRTTLGKQTNKQTKTKRKCNRLRGGKIGLHIASVVAACCVLGGPAQYE